MTCQIVLWIEGLYLGSIGLVSWRIAARHTSNLTLLVSAAAWIAAGFVLFWIVEIVAMTVALGGYSRELGWCPPGATVLRLGQYSLIWIPAFVLACAWMRLGGRNSLSGGGARE